MAACPVLRLVTVSYDDLTVFALPDCLVAKTGTCSGLTRPRTIAGVEPMKFGFFVGSIAAGRMALTGSSATTRLLLVTDAGNDAVHVIDAVHGRHVGYLAAPGTINRPRGVAARGTKAAVSIRKGGFAVRLYEGSGTTWTIERIIGHVVRPYGLRFTSDGKDLAVVEECDRKMCVCLFRVEDGDRVAWGHPVPLELFAFGLTQY
jgi:hypothetical protein